MLFVDDDRAEPLNRREDCGARADHDPLFTAPQRLPGGEALALTERRMEQGDVIAEGGAEAGEGLGGERDLGDQHDGAATAATHEVAQQLDVDQSLAGPGHALEDEHAGLGPIEGGAQPAERRALGLGGLVSRLDRHVQLAQRVGRRFFAPDLGQPLTHQPLHHRAAHSQRLGQVGDFGAAADGLEILEQLALAPGATEDAIALLQARQLPGQRHHLTGAARDLDVGCLVLDLQHPLPG